MLGSQQLLFEAASFRFQPGAEPNWECGRGLPPLDCWGQLGQLLACPVLDLGEAGQRADRSPLDHDLLQQRRPWYLFLVHSTHHILCPMALLVGLAPDLLA